MSDNDDLDALLDEAMDIVDEQDRVHQEEVKQQEAKLEADLQKALEEQGGGSGDALGADMVKMFQALLGGGGAEGLGDDASFDTFKADVAKLVATLENVDDLKDEDMANLTRVKELMSVLENDDEDKAKELLDQMNRDPTTGMPTGDASPEAADAAFKSCMEALQQLSEATGASGVSGDETAAADASPSSASPGVSVAEDVPDNLAELLLSAILDPDFAEPIKVMRDAYEPFLAAKDADLSQDEKATYRKQHAKTIEICEFLKEPVHKEDDVRVTRLLELMHEFSELGEPPKDLSTFAPRKEEGLKKDGEAEE